MGIRESIALNCCTSPANVACAQIVEGAITIVFGLIAWFYLPNFPEQNVFLSQEETAQVLERVEKDRGDSVPDSLSPEKVLRHLQDWKIWTFGTRHTYFLISCVGLIFGILTSGLMYMCATMPAYAIRYISTPSHYLRPAKSSAFSFFVTIILRGMGWSVTASLLLVGFLSYLKS